jgi:hypothetical protein
VSVERYGDGVSEDVVTAADLEAMSPSQRQAVFEASLIHDLADAPQQLVDRARTRVEDRIAASERR